MCLAKSEKALGVARFCLRSSEKLAKDWPVRATVLAPELIAGGLCMSSDSGKAGDEVEPRLAEERTDLNSKNGS